MQESAPLSSFLPTAPLRPSPLLTNPTLSGSELPHVEPPTPMATRVLDAADLLAGARQVVIEHQGKLYRLSLTKNDRLILQK